MKVEELRAHARELGFVPADGVRWFAPGELARTALQAGLASAFSTFTDKRELQRSFPEEVVTVSPDADGGCWLDYVADLGDGFDPTYTVALLVAEDRLTVDGLELPRGRLLAFGGDEVYPTGSSQRYEDRLKGPYRSALPETDVPEAEAPMLVALPGNHDWYDGLTSFLRVFAQRRRIGAWRTVQSRSYYVVELPQRWWLVGLDSQFGTEIDDPQLDYFRTHLTGRLQEGDGVVLSVAGPRWVRTPGDHTAYDSLHWFERSFVRPAGAQVRLWITGDLHHYARYEETGVAAPRQYVTCGLGGAYLTGTHRLPETLELPPRDSVVARPDDPAGFRLITRWPDATTSRRLVRGLFLPIPRSLPFRNQGFWRLAGVVHALLFLALIGLLGLTVDRRPVEALRSATPLDALRIGAQIGVWLLVAIIGWSLLPVLRRRLPRAPNTAAIALALQFVVAVGGLMVTIWVVRVTELPGWFPGGRELPDFVLLGVALAVTGLLTGLVGSYAVALTLALGRERMVEEWQMSAQAIEDRKGFVRIRVEPDGRLVLYPVAVDEVCHDWDLVAGGDRGSRVLPAGDLPTPHLIEPPVTVTRG